MNPELPRDLGRIIRRCLAKDPERRCQSAKDLRNELEELKQDVAAGELTGGPPAATSLAGKAKWRQWVFALALASISAMFAYNLRDVLQSGAPSSVPRLTRPVQVTFSEGLEDYPVWSSDGRTLAYHSNENGNFDIWLKQLGGANALNRTADHPGADQFPSWSPDGNEIAFWSDREGQGYFVMSALAGPARKVAAGELAGPAQWSADGSELGYFVHREDGFAFEILSLRRRTTARVLGPEAALGPIHPAWSADGRLVAWLDANNYSTNAHRLVTSRIDDGVSFPVTDGRGPVWSPSWSQDGRGLFFVSNRGGGMDLWHQRVSFDGAPVGGAEPVTTALGIRSASFSGDGSKLAYSKGRPVANLWRIPILEDRSAVWKDAEQLTFDQASILTVSISADGTQLVVTSDRGGNLDLWRLGLADGSLLQLTTDPALDFNGHLSSDGEEVVFHSTRVSGNRDIWTVPLGGGPARQLTNDPLDDFTPTWSPDGNHIAFVSSRSGNYDIWVVSSGGGEPRQMTTHVAQDWYPYWSPDGRWIVFSSYRDGEAQNLWKVPAGGGDPTRITAVSASNPTWSPDGTTIYFKGAADRDFWAHTLDGRYERRVTALRGRRGKLGNHFATDGVHLYFPWQEDLGDIWVMDVVTDESE